MMNPVKPLHDKDPVQKKNYDAATTLPVYVSYCLGSCAECTGFYSDDAGIFLLKCACVCHQDRHNVKKNNMAGVNHTPDQTGQQPTQQPNSFQQNKVPTQVMSN
jgi:hypothetical protein